MEKRWTREGRGHRVPDSQEEQKRKGQGHGIKERQESEERDEKEARRVPKSWTTEERKNTEGGSEWDLMRKGEVKGKIKPNINLQESVWRTREVKSVAFCWEAQTGIGGPGRGGRKCIPLNPNLSFYHKGYRGPWLTGPTSPPWMCGALLLGPSHLAEPPLGTGLEAGVLSYTPGANRAAQSSYCSYFNHGFCFTNPALKPYTVLKFYGSSWGGLWFCQRLFLYFSKVITEFPFFPPQNNYWQTCV